MPPNMGTWRTGQWIWIQIDDVDIHALQAAIASCNDVFCGQVAAAIVHPGHAARGAGYFGGDHQLFACTGVGLEPIADDFFGSALKVSARGGTAVHLGRIDEVYAPLQRAAQDGVGGGFIDLLTEGHGAQADGRYAQIALTKGTRSMRNAEVVVVG